MEETIFNLEPATRAATSLPPVAIAVIAVLILLILAAMGIVLRRYLTQPAMPGMSREEIEKIGASSVMGGKMAIVEADKLLDSSLKSMTIPGETLGERLKFASYKYPELRKVWFAHKLRNQLVHEASFEISVSQAKAALHEYKKALRVIHVL